MKSVGRLCRLAGAEATRTYRYDALGRLSSSKLAIAGESTEWESFTAYDAMSRVRSLVYPVTGLKLDYAYKPSGFLDAITEPVAGKTHWQALARFADGQVGSFKAGSYTTSRTYDALGRPARSRPPESKTGSTASTRSAT